MATKCKTPHETAQVGGKLHGYLGHFAKPEHINRGHNVDWTMGLGKPKKSLFEQEMEKAKAKESAPTPAPTPPTPPAEEDKSKRRQQIDKAIEKSGG